ncbi:MAG TPA: hypothetical protein VIH61_00475 [Waddliaceae bacterium]
MVGIFLITLIFFWNSLFGFCGNNKTAWVQQRNHFCLSGSYWNYSSDHFWNANGNQRDAFNKFTKEEYVLYLEYGLTQRDTLWLKDGWARIRESVNGRTLGFADMEIGWKRYLGQKWGAAISGEIVGIIPIESEHKPGLRYGRYGGEFNLLLSKEFSYWKLPGWYDFRLGYRAYEGFPSDQIRADAAATFNLFPCVKLLLAGHLEYGLFNGHSIMNQSFFCLFSNYRLLKGQVELLFSLYKEASLFVGYQRHIWGKNVGTGGLWYGGVQVQF